MNSWYLVKTKFNQEQIATVNLENQNFKVYCPRSIISNKNVVLFPGYIFIQLDQNLQNFSAIKSTKGVINFVRFGLSFAKIPNNVIDLIKKNEFLTAQKIISLDNFNKGDNVKITDGVFKNCIAIFKSIKADERVTLLMNLMGQEQSININKNSIIAL